MQPTITEIAPDIYRVSTFVPEVGMQFAQFVVLDDEPLLFHTGMRSLFPIVREAVGRILDPARLRWISFSHFEADESGTLNEWLTLAPQAEPLCNLVGALVSVNDFAIRPARGLVDSEVFETGRRRFRFLKTPHLPHGWDAGLLFEETTATLFCSDLFHQLGDVEPITESDVIERVRHTITEFESGPFARYLPYTTATPGQIDRLAALRPSTLATMHGSVYRGDGARALRDLGTVLRDVAEASAQAAPVATAAI